MDKTCGINKSILNLNITDCEFPKLDESTILLDDKSLIDDIQLIDNSKISKNKKDMNFIYKTCNNFNKK